MPEKFSPQPEYTDQSFNEGLDLPKKAKELKRWFLEQTDDEPYSPLLARCRKWTRKLSLALPLYFVLSGSSPIEAKRQAEESHDYMTLDSITYDLEEVRSEAEQYQTLADIDWQNEDIYRNYEEVLEEMGYHRYYRDYKGQLDEKGHNINTQIVNGFPNELKDYPDKNGYAITTWYGEDRGRNSVRDAKYPGLIIGKKFDVKEKAITEIIFSVDNYGKAHYILSLKTTLPDFQTEKEVLVVREPFYVSDIEDDPLLVEDAEKVFTAEERSDLFIPSTEQFEKDTDEIFKLVGEYSLAMDEKAADPLLLFKDIKIAINDEPFPVNINLQHRLTPERREQITNQVYESVKVRFEKAYQLTAKNRELKKLLGEKKFNELMIWFKDVIATDKILIPYKTAIEDLRINPSYFIGRRAKEIRFYTKKQLAKIFGESDALPLGADATIAEILLLNIEELLIESDRNLDELLAVLLHEISHEVAMTIPEEGGYHAWEVEEDLPNWLTEGMNEAYTLFGQQKYLDDSHELIRAGYSGGPTSAAILLCLASGSPTAVLRDYASGRIEMTRILFDQKYGQGTFDRLTSDLVDDDFYSPNLLEARLIQLVSQSGGNVEKLYADSQEIFSRIGEGFLALGDQTSGSSVFASFHTKTQKEFDDDLKWEQKFITEGETANLDLSNFVSIYAQKEVQIGDKKYSIFFNVSFQEIKPRISDSEVYTPETEGVYSYENEELKKFITDMEETKKIFYKHYDNPEVAEKEFCDHLNFVCRLPQHKKLFSNSIRLTLSDRDPKDYINNQALCEYEARIYAEKTLQVLKNLQI